MPEEEYYIWVSDDEEDTSDYVWASYYENDDNPSPTFQHTYTSKTDNTIFTIVAQLKKFTLRKTGSIKYKQCL